MRKGQGEECYGKSAPFYQHFPKFPNVSAILDYRRLGIYLVSSKNFSLAVKLPCSDAFCSSYQPAIDAFQLSLMMQFNRPSPVKQQSLRSRSSVTTASSPSSFQPLIYGTYQAYLRRYVRTFALII